MLSYLRAPTPNDLDAEVLCAFVADLAGRARAASPQPPDALGIGCGGPMVFPEGIVSPLHIPVWQDFPLRARLEAALDLPAVLDNDAELRALANSDPEHATSGPSIRPAQTERPAAAAN